MKPISLLKSLSACVIAAAFLAACASRNPQAVIPQNAISQGGIVSDNHHGHCRSSNHVVKLTPCPVFLLPSNNGKVILTVSGQGIAGSKIESISCDGKNSNCYVVRKDGGLHYVIHAGDKCFKGGLGIYSYDSHGNALGDTGTAIFNNDCQKM